MLTGERYTEYCKRFKQVYEFLEQNSKPKSEVALEICKLRGYYPERMLGTLVKMGFLYIEDESCFEKLRGAGKDLALFNDTGFRLKGRYIFPVRDMLGNILALIGWIPGGKYVTTPSALFSKSCLFYGLEQFSTMGIGKKCILVEGIFDSISVRSLGIPCMAFMGVESSRYKVALYSLFSQLVGIPDCDVQGKEVVKLDKWSLPTNSKYLIWRNSSSSGYIKDIDELCNSYEEEDVRDLILGAFTSKDRVVTVNL